MVHLGNNIAKLRSFRRMPQKEVAAMLNMTQPEYSRIESKEKIDDDLLDRIAEVINYPIEVIKGLNDNTNQNIYQNEINGGNGVCYVSNPVEMIVDLYERLLESERSKIKLLEDIINKSKIK